VIYALAFLAAFVGLALQVWGLIQDNLRIALGCPDCRKGARCARCLAESEAIRPKPEGSA